MNKLFKGLTGITLGLALCFGFSFSLSEKPANIVKADNTASHTLSGKGNISASDSFPFNITYGGTFSWNSPQLRFTSTDGVVTFAGNDDVEEIKSIDIGCSSSGYAPAGTASTGYTCSVSSSTVKITGSGSSTVVWTLGAAGRLKTYSISYVKKGSAASTYKVTYNLNGGTGGTIVDSTQYENGATVTVLGIGEVTKENCTFVDWSDGTNHYDEGDTFTINSNVTLTAQWQYKPYEDDTTNSIVTWDLTVPTYVSSSTSQMNWTSPKAEFVASKGSASTNTNNYCPPSYQTTRFYKNSYMTFNPSEGYQINKLVITAGSVNYASALTNSEWNNATASVENSVVTVVPTDKKVSFEARVGDTVGVNLIKVYYGVATNEPSVSLSPDAVSFKTTETDGVTVTATADNIEEPTFYWSTEDSNISLENINSATVTIKPNTNVAGTATVYVTVGGVEPAITESVAVTISIPGPGEVPETAYTAEQATAAITNSESDIPNVYVKGTISYLEAFDSKNGEITYYVSEDGTRNSEFKIYKGKNLNNQKFSSLNDLSVGDTVIVYGTISKTYINLNAGNVIVSYTPAPCVHEIVLTPAIVTVAPNDSGNVVDLFDSIVINQDDGVNNTANDIEWASSDDNIVLISSGQYLVDGSHKQAVTISASIDGKVYGAAEIRIVDPNQPYISYESPIIAVKVSEIVIGDEVIFVNEAAGKEFTGMSGYNYGTASNYDTNFAGTYVLTIEEGNAEGSFAFKTVDNDYISWASGNTLTVIDEINDHSSWTIDPNFNGGESGWKFRNVSDENRRLSYNHGSPRFACYDNDGQHNIEIYKKTGGGNGTIDLDDTILNLVRSHMSVYQDNNGDDQYGIDVCDYNGATLDKTSWDAMGDDFTSSIIETYKLNYAAANIAGNDVEKFLSAYDYVVAKYGEDYDFLGRIATGKVSASYTNKFNRSGMAEFLDNSDNGIIILLIISTLGAGALSAFYLVRKRKRAQ